MLLNARKVFYEGNNSTSLLVGIEDVTERRALERDKDELLRRKDLLLQKMAYRINNSLNIIASSGCMLPRSVARWLGAVFLYVTGAETLYADMGHFDARPIRLAWPFASPTRA